MKSSANFGHAQVNTWPHVRAARDPAAPGGQASGSRPAMVGRSSDFGHTRRASPRTEEDLDTILYHFTCTCAQPVCTAVRQTHRTRTQFVPISPARSAPRPDRTSRGPHRMRSRGRRWMCARNTLMGILKGTGRVWSAGVRRGRGVRLSLSNKRPAIRTVYRMQKPIRFCDG